MVVVGVQLFAQHQTLKKTVFHKFIPIIASNIFQMSIFMFEKFLFKKIELWIFFVFAIIAITVVILFGAAVLHYKNGGSRLGRLGPVVESIAAFPSVVKTVLYSDDITGGNEDLLASEQRFNGITGFKFNYKAGARPDLGYVLVNRYDGDQELSISELWDLNLQEKVHTWSFGGADAVWAKSKLKSKTSNFRVNSATKRFRNSHSFLDKNGNLITHAGGAPIIRADFCSSLMILNDEAIYHHSIEQDSNGNYWIPKYIDPKKVDIGGVDFLDDGIAQISLTGKVLFEKSVIQILDQNELGYFIYGKGYANKDPIHLNDIQPVLADGRFWKKGDVFLSLRHQSMILLYRPSTNKVIWYKQGPWMHQHDVDIINDHEISVFNNNAALAKVSDWVVRGSNNILIYDFENNTIRSPFQVGFFRNELRTKTEGRSDIVGDEVFVEETNYGRLIQFSPEGKVSWQFVNRTKDGKVYILNWSRLIPRDLGDKTRALISQRACP